MTLSKYIWQCSYTICRHVIAWVVLILYTPVSATAQHKNIVQLSPAQQTQLKYYANQISAYRYSAYLDSTKYFFGKALPIALLQNDSVIIFNLYKQLGDAYEHHQYKDSTLQMYDICEQYIPAQNYKLRSFLLLDKAYTYQLLHNYEKEVELNIEALVMANKSGDMRQIGSVNISLAESFSNIGLYDKAVQYFTDAINVLEKEKDTNRLHLAYRYYAIHLIKTKQIPTAYQLLIQANTMAASLNDSISMAYNWLHLSSCYWHTKQVDSCLMVAKRAEAIWEKRVEYLDLADVCLQLGIYYTALNKYIEAEYYLKKAESHIVQNLNFNQKLYSAFAELYTQNGNGAAALLYLQKANNALELISENERKSKIAGLAIKYETAKKETENKTLATLNTSLTVQKWVAITACIVLLVFAILLYTLYSKKQRINKQLLAEKNIVEQQAAEKIVLVNEIHHRVKNNLTMLKSLLYLQGKAATQDETKRILTEAQSRVQSMALVHQNLYDGNNAAKLNLTQFIEALYKELQVTYVDKNKIVSIVVQGSCSNVDIETAIPLALIMNELATNSFKYAFNNAIQGVIHTDITQEHNNIVITYTDNGPGLINPFDITKGGFGFKVLHILTQQLNATISYNYNEARATFIITVPVT